MGLIEELNKRIIVSFKREEYVPIKRGKWIWYYKNPQTHKSIYQCSICNYRTKLDLRPLNQMNYCPCCGGKMDLK